jgi:hypothetical protein
MFDPTSNYGLGLGRVAQWQVRRNAIQKVLRGLWRSGSATLALPGLWKGCSSFGIDPPYSHFSTGSWYV